MKNQRGFTLAGMSVVLMIVAIITALVITGKDLIRTAEVRSVITDFNSFEVSVSTFELKYGEKPGDLPFATSYWPDAGTENGDGDQIFDLPVTEGLRAWQHLSLSVVLDGSYTGELDQASNAEMDFVSLFKGLFINTAYASAQNMKIICHQGTTISVEESIISEHLADHLGDSIGDCNVYFYRPYNVCHVDDSGKKTTVATTSIEKYIHLDHGDTFGECIDDSDSDGSDDSDSDGSEKKTLCHINNGSGAVTITVTNMAIYNAHLNHGDVEGECEGNENSTNNETYIGKYTVGMNVPAARMKAAGFSLEYTESLYGRSGNLITFAAESEPLLGGVVLSPSEAWIIDEKIDDGQASTGNIVTTGGELKDGRISAACLNDNMYNLPESGKACQIHFWIE